MLATEEKQPTPTFTSSLSSSEVILVDWDGPNDPENPLNWSVARKWLLTVLSLVMTFVALMNGTIITVAHEVINERFHVSDAEFPHSYWPVTSWALGGIVFALIGLPVMEDFGTRRTFLFTHLMLILFVIPQAVAQNFATLIVTRFFAGGCVTVIGNAGASVIGNIWATEKQRSKPISLWIWAYVTGSSMGPVIGAAILQGLMWRWISYLQLIWYGVLLPVNLAVFSESRGAVILQQRAKRLRAQGKQAYTREEQDAEPLLPRLVTSIRRPLQMLVTEYVVFFSTLWASFTVGTLYLFTQSVGQVFAGLYGWSPISTGYVQTAVVVGEVIGWTLTVPAAKLYFDSARRNRETPGVPIPEARLYMSVVGSILGITGGMFVYAWTSYPTLPWIAPAVGLAMVGAGSVMVMSGLADYVVDAYSQFAGSVVACFVLGENLFSAFLPLAAMKMYQTLGFQWASTLLAFISLMLVLAPISFVIWGKKLRENSPLMKEAKEAKEGRQEMQ